MFLRKTGVAKVCVLYRVRIIKIIAPVIRPSGPTKASAGIHPSLTVEGKSRMPTKPSVEISKSKTHFTGIGVVFFRGRVCIRPDDGRVEIRKA